MKGKMQGNSMPARGIPVWALYVITVAIWGSSWYGIKEQLGVVAPTVSLAYRFALAAAILWVFCAVTRRRLRFPVASHVWMALQALCLFGANYILFYYAGFHVVSGLLALCFSTIPLMNVFNAAFFVREPVDRNVILPSLISLAGLVLVFLPEFLEKGLGSSPVIGFGLSMIATYLASLGNVLSVKLKQVSVPVVQANTWGMTYGALFCAVFALFQGASFNYDPRTAFTVSLVLLAVFASVIGFGTYLTLVQRIGAGRAAFSSVLFPLVALSISTVVEDHHWTPLAVAGVVLVLSGNLILLLRRRVAPPVAELQKGPAQ
jgi:drug/metabolite transporter (DMT)-like permease